MIQQINALALAQAAEFVVGEEKALEIGRIYRIIDDAMFAGYELGKADALQVLQHQTDEAFDNGFEEGAEQGHTEGYDSGYLEGVSDARARPATADANVSVIIGEQEDAEDQGDLFDRADEYMEFLEPAPGCDCPECAALRDEQDYDDFEPLDASEDFWRD